MYKPEIPLQIRNFGPIARGRIRLRPFTVFVGPSNSGKSYLATFIYALHSFFAGSHRPGIMGPGAFQGRELEPLNYLLATREQSITALEAAHLSEWAVRTSDNRDVAFQEGSQHCIQIPERFLTHISRLINAFGERFHNELAYCTGINDATRFQTANSRLPTQISIFSTTRRPRHGSSSQFDIRLEDGVWVVESVPSKGATKFELVLDPDESRYFREMTRQLATASADRLEFEASEFIVYLAECILKKHLSPFGHKSYYFPAARNGATILYTTLLREAISRRDTREGSHLFPGTISDLVSILLDVGNAASDSIHPEKAETTRLENTVLEGSFEIDSNLLFGLHGFKYKPKGGTVVFPLQDVASMVSTLAPVALCVRYLARPGSVLIIEEPEAHMHPRKQVELTRELAYLVSTGIHVVITTHSEWILEEVTNIVKRSATYGDQQNSASVTNIALDKSQVGVWHFKRLKDRNATKIVRAVRNPSGLYEIGYDEVARDLYQDWVSMEMQSDDH